MKPLHPTILVGYGRYGLHCLQSLLAGAAARGELAWDEHSEVGAIDEKRLSSLALFWIPDVLGLDDQRVRTESQTQSGFEMMEDLFAQIEPLAADEKLLSTTVARRLDAAKARLFDEYHRVHHEREITLGLDMIVIGQATHEGVIGKIREVIVPAMKLLASDPGLASPGPGQDLLNFTQILDFEDYWNAGPNGTAIRTALSQMIGAAEIAVRQDQPAFGRTYLFDGRTAGGNHQESVRMDEVVLLLDFLLFEGQRSASQYRFLFQREEDGAAPVCTLGIRAIEHSTGKLRRLAAASFARGWLEYLIGESVPLESSPLRAAVMPLLPNLSEATHKRGNEDAEVESAVAEIRKQLLTIDSTQQDWPQLVRERCRQLVAEMKSQMSRKAISDAGVQKQDHAGHLRSRLESTVSEMLVRSTAPITVGAAIAETDSLLALLSTELGDEAPVSEARPSTSALESVHAKLRDFQGQQVQPARLKHLWWPLVSISLALAYLPSLREFISSIFGDEWGPKWLQTLAPAAAIAGGSWTAGVALFQPRIAGFVERAQRFFTDPERGRLTDAIGVLLDSEGVRGDLHAHVESERRASRSRMNNELIAELRRIRSALEQRRREIEWLNSQLLRYLELHSVDSSAEVPRYQSDRRGSAVIQMVERQEDLERIALGVTRKPADFRDMQRKLRILSNWSDRFCATFLEPHRFLDKLGESFPAPQFGDGEEAQQWAQRVAGGIRTVGQLPVSFYWYATDRLPQRISHAAVPFVWSRLGPVSEQLGKGGYATRRTTISGGERLYLIQTQMGVPQELLTRTQS